MRLKKHTKEQLIKNTQGAISLMLALLMVPFYSVAAILVETGRYHSAYRGLDSAISASELSVLAQKDSYLFERFGLLAVDQETNISSEFWSYLNKQDTLDTRSFKLSQLQSSVEGVYPLADINVLRQQIEEFSKTIVPTKIAMDVGNLDNLVGQIESYNTLFSSTLKMLDKVESSMEKGIKSYEAQEKAKEKMEQAVANKKDYDEKYKILEDALNALNDHLKTERPSDETEAAQWDKKLEELKNAAVDARDDYKKSTSSTNTSISDVAKKMDDAVQAETSAYDSVLDSITTYTNINVKEDINEALKGEQEQIDKELQRDDLSDHERDLLLNEKIQLEKDMMANTDSEKLGKDIVNSQKISDDTKETLKKYNSEECTDAVKGLTDELKELDKLDFDNVSSDNIEEVLGKLHTTDLGKFSSADEFDALWKKTREAVEKAELDFGDLFDALIEVLNIDTSYDPELNSIIDETYYNNFGGIPSKQDRTRESQSLQSIFESEDMQTAKENLEKLGLPVLESEGGSDVAGNPSLSKNEYNANSSGNILKKALNLVKTIKSKVNDTVKMLGQLSNIKDKMSEGMLLKGYLAYSLSNRVNYRSGTSLAGMSYLSSGGLMEADDDRDLVVGTDAMYEIGDKTIDALTGGLIDTGGRKAYSFCGAELEYVMFGSLKEKENQKAAYERLVLTNLLLCIIQTYTNDFVRMVTDSVSTAASVVPGLPVLAQIAIPLALAYVNATIDTIKLCNGGKVALLKQSSDLNITPEGLVAAINDLTKLQLVNKSEVKNSLEKLQKETNKATSAGAGTGTTNSTTATTATTGSDSKPVVDGGKYASSLNKVDYTEFMTILLLLFWNDEAELLNRFVDIIQMEQTNRFNTVDNTQYSLEEQIGGKRKKFDVDTAYTMIRVQATGKFVNVLPVPNLSKSSAWRVNRLLYRGY